MYLLDTHRHKSSVQRPCESRFVSCLGKNHRNKNAMLENLSKYSQFSVFHVQKPNTFILLSFVYCPILAFFEYFRRLCYSLYRKRYMTESIKINKSWRTWKTENNWKLKGAKWICGISAWFWFFEVKTIRELCKKWERKKHTMMKLSLKTSNMT